MQEKNIEQLKTEIAVRNKCTDSFSFYNTIPDPDPILRQQGIDLHTYRSMLSDSQIWTCYQSRKAGVMSKEWSVDRGKAKSRNSKTIESLFNDLDIEQLISDIIDAPFFGFQPIEIIWEYTGAGIFPKQLIAKPSEWFTFNTNNELVLKSKYGTPEELPQYKFLCPKYNASYINPFGEKNLSRCFWPTAFRKGGYKFWVTFAEKFGMPTTVGKIPTGKSQDELDDFANTLNTMVQDAVIVITDDSTIELKEASGKAASSEIYNSLIEVCNADISKVILGQTLTTEVGKTGSYAASKTHFEVRKDIVESDRKLAEKTINQLVNWIYELNWKGVSDKPVFSMWEEEDVDKNLAERDKILTDTGVKFTKKYFIKAYGLEEEDFEITSTQKTDVNIQGQFADKSKPQITLIETNKQEFKDQRAIDNLITSFDDKELQNQFKDALNPILTLFKESPDKAMEKLSELYPEMDSGKLEETLANAIFVSEIWGRLNAKE